MTLQDLKQVVRIHLEAFPGFFLSFLGPRFLAEFYRGTVEDSSSLALVAEDERGELVGFVAGHLEPGGFYRRLALRRGWAFGIASLAALVRRPIILPRLVRALWYRGNPPEENGGALLASLAVSVHRQARGVGRLLTQAFVEKCRNRGASYVYLTTDRDGNETVNNFYQKNGWALDKEYATPEGRMLNRYCYHWGAAARDHS
jgi:GNAT superfamily N-acetyltransferase